MSEFTIVGSVVSRANHSPVPGLKVQAWDKDLIHDDFLGQAETDADGIFKITFAESAFRSLFGENNPDVFFRVYEDDLLIETTEDSVLWNLTASSRHVIIEVTVEVEAEAKATAAKPTADQPPAAWSAVATDRLSPVDFDRINRLHLTGSIPYTDRELIERRQVIAREMTEVYQAAERIGLSPAQLFQAAPLAPGQVLPNLRDNGSNGEAGTPPSGTTKPETPCCTPEQIAAGLGRIRAAYTAAVAKVDKWKGCQDWATIVAEAVKPVLGPCWIGKYVWRISVWPFGRWTPFDDGDTFIHHAFAICPCTCPNFGGCTECIVLDPYTITGWAWRQSARTYPFADWISEGNVWRASTNPDHDNCSIYRDTMQYYCSRSNLGLGPLAACKEVRRLLMREVARYTGQSGPTLDLLYRQCGLVPSCC